MSQITILQDLNSGGKGLEKLVKSPIRAIRDALVCRFDLLWKEVVGGRLGALVIAGP